MIIGINILKMCWASAFIYFISKLSIMQILQIKNNVGKTAFIDIKPNRAYLPLLKLYQNGQEAFIEKILS